MEPNERTADGRGVEVGDWTAGRLRELGPRVLLAEPGSGQHRVPSQSPSDFDLDTAIGGRPQPGPPGAANALRAAAVLVPLVMRDQLQVLLTQRSAHLPTHAGQIAFPGGKIDAGDASPLAAALREAREEVGLAPRHVETLGYLDTYRTRTGFAIVPVVALVDAAFELRLEAGEVDDAFEVPLAFLLDPANHQRHHREHEGIRRHFYAMPYQHRYIWGATAGILRNLYDRISQA